MDLLEFQETLRAGGVNIEELQAEITGRKPIYCYAAKGPILLEDQDEKLVGVLLDYKDRNYPLTPAVHDTHVFPGGRWEATDATPLDTFARERGEESFIPHAVLTGEVVVVGDFYSQFPCPNHGTYADLTSIFANRVPIDALCRSLNVKSDNVDTLIEAVNQKATECRQRVILVDQLMRNPERYGFMDGGKLAGIVQEIYGIKAKVADTAGGVLIKLPTNPKDSYESRREIFTYLHQNRLDT